MLTVNYEKYSEWGVLKKCKKLIREFLRKISIFQHVFLVEDPCPNQDEKSDPDRQLNDADLQHFLKYPYLSVPLGVKADAGDVLHAPVFDFSHIWSHLLPLATDLVPVNNQYPVIRCD